MSRVHQSRGDSRLLSDSEDWDLYNTGGEAGNEPAPSHRECYIEDLAQNPYSG